MSTFKSIPTQLKGSLLKRQEQLFLKVASIEGHLYSLGAAVSECRKELNHIRRELTGEIRN